MKPRREIRLKLAGGALLACSATALGQPEFEIVDLGQLPSFGDLNTAEGLNESSQVAGGTAGAGGGEGEPFLWEEGHLIDLGKLPPWFHVSVGIDVNESTMVLIRGDDTNGGFGTQLWNPIDGLVDPDIGFSNRPTAINDIGQVCLTHDGLNIWPTVAYVWSEGSLAELEHGPFFWTYAGGLNNLGQVVGSADDHAVLWPHPQDVIDIHPPFAAISRAIDINDAEQVVGLYQLPGTDKDLRVFLLNDGEYLELTTLVDLDKIQPRSDSLQVNNVGEVVGTDFKARRAFLVRGRERHDLINLLDTQQTDWTDILAAFDINDAGRIVGCGYRKGFPGTRAFIMIPKNEFRTTGPIPGSAGTKNLIRAYNATPNGKVVFAYGTQRGSFVVQRICPGVELGIDRPRLAGSAIADAEGEVNFHRPVTTAAADSTIFIQAIDLESCRTSPVVAHHFPAE